MKKAGLMLFLFLFLCACPAMAEKKPVLHADKTEVEMGEKLHLSWNEPEASKMVLAVKSVSGSVECVEHVPVQATDYPFSYTDPGEKSFYLMAWYGEHSVVVGDPILINIKKGPLYYLSQGMDNVWKINIRIYHSIDTPKYRNSFSQKEIDHIYKLADELPDTLLHLSDGRMHSIITKIKEITEPITSISGPEAMLQEGRDIQFQQEMAKDITLTVIYAPLEKHPDLDWLGLGGYEYSYNGHTTYMVKLSSAYAEPRSGTWMRNGFRYDVGTCALVHEILHAVELNSQRNGWEGFTGLHDAEKNGYTGEGTGFLDWYSDLMTDSLKTGRPGFRKESFYVHHNAEIFPQQWIEKGTPRIDSRVDCPGTVYIPPSVTYISPNAFVKGVIIFGETGSAAEAWAERNGFIFYEWEP